jgi:hypothetical protein
MDKSSSGPQQPIADSGAGCERDSEPANGNDPTPDPLVLPRPGFSKLKEDDVERVHGKSIKCLIRKHRDYIVYLDNEMSVWWAINENSLLLENALSGEVLNEVSYLECVDVTALKPHQLEGFRRMLGEAVARLLDTKDPNQARAVLSYARQYITARFTENARLWYLSASSIATLLVTIIISSLLLNREAIHLGEKAVTVILGIGGGALGALLSILLRSEGVPKDISAGRKLYYCEAISKIVAGMIGALIMALGIEAKFFLGNLDVASNHVTVIMLFCLVAGAGERLIPSLISKVELTDSL